MSKIRLGKITIRCVVAIFCLSVSFTCFSKANNPKKSPTIQKVQKLPLVNNPKKVLVQISQEVQKGPLSREKEERYAKQLRLLLNEDPNVIDHFDVMDVFLKMRKNIRHEFPSITDAEYDDAKHSVGVALLSTEKRSQALDILLREAKCVCAGAQLMLKIMYQYPTQGFKQYDPNILAFFKMTAEEGSPRGRYDYGQALLNGWGIKQNVKEGLNCLDSAGAGGITEAYLDLVEYYMNQNDEHNFERYLRLSAGQNNPMSTYNLAILEQDRKNYKEAFSLFNKVLKIDSNYHAAKLELGRMYIEGWGIKQDIQKGFNLIKEVSEHNDDKRAQAIAYMNLGMFYRNGVGVQISLSTAKEYFKKAETLGFIEARKYIEALG